MAEGNIVVTAGSGVAIHSNTRTISSTTMHDQYVLPGEFAYASYIASTTSISIATANSHVIQLMASSSLNVRVRRIRLEQSGNATTGVVCAFQLFRLSTAGTGGSAITPAPFDTADSASGATAQTLPSAKGTETTMLMQTQLVMRQAVSATGAQVDDAYEWYQLPGTKPIVIPAGTSNGLALKVINATAGATVTVSIEFIETSFI